MSLASALIDYARSGGKNETALYRALAQRDAPPTKMAPLPSVAGTGGGASFHGTSAPPYTGKGLLTLPTRWKGTHDTSGADWNANRATAADIMARAGTLVGAPEAGRVVYYHPEGAQGGGSLLFDPQAPGPNYWLGHLDAGAPAGTRVKRGGYLARVSSRHAAPHVHIDRTG